MLSFGRRRDSDATRPLLPQYNDDTALQRAMHQKLHSYQMIRAIRYGYMPSTEQLVANLRSLLAAELLNPSDPALSDSGRRLTKFAKDALKAFIILLQHKNSDDQLQDLIWESSHARVSVDVADLANQARRAKGKAEAAAVYQSLHTVGSLLMSNADFRLFLADLSTVARQVFQDAAHALSGVAEEAGERLAPSEEAVTSLQDPDADISRHENKKTTPSTDDLGSQAAEASVVVAQGVAKVADEARLSVADKLSGHEKDTLLSRLKQTVLRLRRKPDYEESVSTLSLVLKRWALAYSQALQETTSTLQGDVQENAAADRAALNAWSLLKSFGDKKEWDQLELCLKRVFSHKDKDPQYEDLVVDMGNSLEKMLTDPDFLDSMDEKLEELKRKSTKVGSESGLREDIDAFLLQLQRTVRSVLNDEDVAKLIHASSQMLGVLSPSGDYVNSDLVQDSLNVFVPLLIQAVQTIPIPRVEISTPEIDLLLENIIITPGHTVNHSSFLPYKLGISTQNDIVVRKSYTSQVASSVSTQVTFKLDGFSIKASEIGYWFRTHTGLLRFTDSGLASFALDEQGVDIHVDVAINQSSLDKVLELKAVRVHIHKLTYNLRSSTFSLIAWLFRPLLKPLIRKVLERQVALAIADTFRAANRELVFARERLRATRIADPKDMMTFFKAVAARLTPEDNPDVYSRVGVDAPGHGVFKGRYAPGSLVKLWAEEGRGADYAIEDAAEVVGRGRRSWRNDIFDVHVGMLT